jgi:hypothetical protein
VSRPSVPLFFRHRNRGCLNFSGTLHRDTSIFAPMRSVPPAINALKSQIFHAGHLPGTLQTLRGPGGCPRDEGPYQRWDCPAAVEILLCAWQAVLGRERWSRSRAAGTSRRYRPKPGLPRVRERCCTGSDGRAAPSSTCLGSTSGASAPWRQSSEIFHVWWQSGADAEIVWIARRGARTKVDEEGGSSRCRCIDGKIGSPHDEKRAVSSRLSVIAFGSRRGSRN